MKVFEVRRNEPVESPSSACPHSTETYENKWISCFTVKQFGNKDGTLDMGATFGKHTVEKRVRIEIEFHGGTSSSVEWSLHFKTYPFKEQFFLSHLGRAVSHLQEWWGEESSAVRFLGGAVVGVVKNVACSLLL